MYIRNEEKLVYYACAYQVYGLSPVKDLKGYNPCS